MKILIQLIAVTAFLWLGFAIGYPVGKNVGFNNGSEWAIIQAEIVAREAGMFMPIHMENGVFRVKLKQPGDLHQRAWKIADKHFEELAIGATCDNRRLVKRVQVARNSHVAQ
jgi:hypothetical protein